jgi:hypothetical protein
MFSKKESGVKKTDRSQDRDMFIFNVHIPPKANFGKYDQKAQIDAIREAMRYRLEFDNPVEAAKDARIPDTRSVFKGRKKVSIAFPFTFLEYVTLHWEASKAREEQEIEKKEVLNEYHFNVWMPSTLSFENYPEEKRRDLFIEAIREGRIYKDAEQAKSAATEKSDIKTETMHMGRKKVAVTVKMAEPEFKKLAVEAEQKQSAGPIMRARGNQG